MKYSLEIVKAAVVKANAAAVEAALEYKAANPDDFGTCGSAVVKADNFGRKRKLREYLEACGVRCDKWSYDWSLSVETPMIDYNQQNVDYPCYYKRAFAKVLAEELEMELRLHTWVD